MDRFIIWAGMVLFWALGLVSGFLLGMLSVFLVMKFSE
jgi:hypothetical protein